MTPVDPEYLATLKQAGWSDDRIAKRFGVPIAQVEATWATMQTVAAQLTESGYESLKALHTNACLQFQELGKSLAAVGFVLANRLPPNEFAQLLEQSKGETDPVAFLYSKCILLRPYVPEQVEAEMTHYTQFHHVEAATQAAVQSKLN